MICRLSKIWKTKSNFNMGWSACSSRNSTLLHQLKFSFCKYKWLCGLGLNQPMHQIGSFSSRVCCFHLIILFITMFLCLDKFLCQYTLASFLLAVVFEVLVQFICNCFDVIVTLIIQFIICQQVWSCECVLEHSL